MTINDHNPNLPPRGLIVDLATPLDKGGHVHRPSLERLIRHVTPHADALLLCGPGCGGGPRSPAERRLEVLHLVAERCDLPLLVFITTTDQHSTLDLAATVADSSHRERTFIVDAPLVTRSNRGLPEWAARLAGTTGRPVILYNHPRLTDLTAGQTKRRNIRTAVLKKTAEEPQGPCGLLFRGEAARMANYQQAVRGRDDFRTYDGQEIRFLDHPSSAGVLSMGANLLPRPWSLVTRAALFPNPKAGSAELLAAAESVRTLATRRSDRLASWLTMGLKQAGIFDPDLPEHQDRPSAESQRLVSRRINLDRWLEPEAE